MAKHLDDQQRKNLVSLLRLRRIELLDDLEENDYSKIHSVEISKRQQITFISQLIDQLQPI